jgi:PAS domain S-box-containing protein
LKDQQDIPDTALCLRRRAEDKAAADHAQAMEPLTPGQMREVLHELRVHQIELEMQNEELRRAQEALEESRARYFDLYDLAPVGYLTLSAKGLILEANLTAADLLGVTRGALARNLLSGFVLREDEDIYYRYRRQLFETLTTQVCELRMARGGASPFWVRLEAAVTPDVPADALVARVVLSDIHERKQAEEALRESQTALLKANKELQLAYQELDSRANQLRLLAGDLTLTEQRERKRLSQTLHDGLQQHLLSAKMRLGGVAESLTGLDIKYAVDEIEEIMSESVKISRSLSAELSPPILHEGGLAEGLEWLARWMRDKHHFSVDLAVEAKPALNEEVKVLVFESVRELLRNAAKHAKVSRARVSLEPAGGARLRVAVSDKGRGFDAARMKPAGEEGGFGLFSVRERIGLIGGSFAIDSAPGKGSRFTLVVPTRQAATVPLADSVRPVAADSGKEKTAATPGAVIRVLLADDHSLFADGLARMLKRKPGIEVVGYARDGQEAVDLAGKLMPDVVLMDISMPKVNGIEATRIIHRENPDIRIIGLSMYDDQERAQTMRDAGASDYKTKGCEASELVSAIRDCTLRP